MLLKKIIFIRLLDRTTSLKDICRSLLIKIKHHSMFKNINPFYKDISIIWNFAKKVRKKVKEKWGAKKQKYVDFYVLNFPSCKKLIAFCQIFCVTGNPLNSIRREIRAKEATDSSTSIFLLYSRTSVLGMLFRSCISDS